MLCTRTPFAALVAMLIVCVGACGAAFGGPEASDVVAYTPIDFAPVSLESKEGKTFDLLAPKDLERTPRHYMMVAATVRTTGIARVALVLVDILNRDYKGEVVKLPHGEEHEIRVHVQRPLSMLRAVRIHIKGQAVEVLKLRIYCAVEKLPEPDAAVRGPMDETSIQAALNSLGDDGGVVYIPAGTYTINNPIIIPASNISVYGDGRDTLLQGTWSGAKELIIAEDKENLRFSRLHLRSLSLEECRSQDAFAAKSPERRHQSSVLKTGIELRGCRNTRVDHCEVELFGNVGIMFEGGTDNLVDHCFVHGYFPYGAGYGIGARGTKETYIEDNNIENHRHSITTYKGCEKSFERFNRLVKDPYAVPDWYRDPKSITYLSSYPINAHPGCGWVCAHDNYVAMTTGLMWSAAEMRGNSGWLYRNVIKACTIGIMCGGNSTDVWTWDNEFVAATENYGSSADGEIHFGERPPSFAETPYPYKLNRIGWWPGAKEGAAQIVKAETQFAGPENRVLRVVRAQQ